LMLLVDALNLGDCSLLQLYPHPYAQSRSGILL